jgi:hypothetical protein
MLSSRLTWRSRQQPPPLAVSAVWGTRCLRASSWRSLQRPCLTLHVMRILAVTPDRTSRVLAVGVVLLVVASVCIILKPKPQVRAVRTASGAVIRLESYAFRPGRVRYYSAQRPLVRLIAKVLPNAAVGRIKWLRPEVTSVVTAPFANEPLLSAAFSSRDASRRVGTPGTRVVVLDDHGQSFDEEVNYIGAFGVFEISAFPRRGGACACVSWMAMMRWQSSASLTFALGHILCGSQSTCL